MEGSEESTVVRPKPPKRRPGLRLLETVGVWLLILGVFVGAGYGVSLMVRVGLNRFDDVLAQSRTHTSVAFSAEEVVAPGIGEPPPGTSEAEPSEKLILVERAEVTNPAWEVVPAPDYPITEGEMVAGTVGLKCTVTVEGRLSGCEILEETPAGRGFGQAALEAADRARLTPRKVQGRPVEGTVQFSIRFTPG